MVILNIPATQCTKAVFISISIGNTYIEIMIRDFRTVLSSDFCFEYAEVETVNMKISLSNKRFGKYKTTQNLNEEKSATDNQVREMHPVCAE